MFFVFVLFCFALQIESHGCCSGRRCDSSRHPTPESAGAGDAEPEEGESAAEKTEGVGVNPDLLVRRAALGGEGLFPVLRELR